jgi:hypothetical protein
VNHAQLIAYLNSIDVGEMSLIDSKLEEARLRCLELAHERLASELGEAREALRRADLKTYRKRVAKVVAQLGHLK